MHIRRQWLLLARSAPRIRLKVDFGSGTLQPAICANNSEISWAASCIRRLHRLLYIASPSMSLGISPLSHSSLNLYWTISFTIVLWYLSAACRSRSTQLSSCDPSGDGSVRLSAFEWKQQRDQADNVATFIGSRQRSDLRPQNCSTYKRGRPTLHSTIVHLGFRRIAYEASSLVRKWSQYRYYQKPCRSFTVSSRSCFTQNTMDR